MSSSKSKRSFSIRQKFNEKLAKLRKQPVVTTEQKLQLKIDSMNKEAQELDAECQELKSKAATFARRAESTPIPSAPPTDRDALFEPGKNAGPSAYDQQVKARNVLMGEWKDYEKEVKAFGKKLSVWQDTVENMKGKHVKPDQAVGKTEHEFIGLDNAALKLNEQRVELSKAVAAVQLPTEN